MYMWIVRVVLYCFDVCIYIYGCSTLVSFRNYVLFLSCFVYIVLHLISYVLLVICLFRNFSISLLLDRVLARGLKGSSLLLLMFSRIRDFSNHVFYRVWIVKMRLWLEFWHLG